MCRPLYRNTPRRLHSLPNPRYARVKSRQEFLLYFPVSKNKSEIKEVIAAPSNSANIIPDMKTGEITIYTKSRGKIEVIVTYEDGSTETKTITSKRADDT